MFLCKDCIEKDKIKIDNKSYALLSIDIGRGSYGPCESCGETGPCADA